MSLGRVGENAAAPRASAVASLRDGAHAVEHLKLGLDNYERSAARRFEDQVRNAADKAQAAFAGKPRKCYRTTEKFMRLMGATSATNPSYSSRGLPLTHLEKLIEMDRLKPGMQIYVCKRPGTDPASLNLGNSPHWAIYVGKDQAGVPRFMDQYRDNWSLDEFVAEYGGNRKIDTIFDPLHVKRPETSSEPREAYLA